MKSSVVCKTYKNAIMSCWKVQGRWKFARVHKRIREVNKQREDKGQKPMFSFLDEEIAAILNIIKEDVDAKVYDRNDILKRMLISDVR